MGVDKFLVLSVDSILELQKDFDQIVVVLMSIYPGWQRQATDC